jgi:hypothetical protein
MDIKTDSILQNQTGRYVLNDFITLKKPHACGGSEWRIARVGVDIKLKCERCGKYINISRDELRKRAINK